MDKIQGKIKFIAPSLQDEHYSTAYILGNITWLMMHSKQHETMPLHMMASQIFPAIANKQYVLGMSEKGSLDQTYALHAGHEDIGRNDDAEDVPEAVTHALKKGLDERARIRTNGNQCHNCTDDHGV